MSQAETTSRRTRTAQRTRSDRAARSRTAASRTAADAKNRDRAGNRSGNSSGRSGRGYESQDVSGKRTAKRSRYDTADAGGNRRRSGSRNGAADDRRRSAGRNAAADDRRRSSGRNGTADDRRRSSGRNGAADDRRRSAGRNAAADDRRRSIGRNGAADDRRRVSGRDRRYREDDGYARRSRTRSRRDDYDDLYEQERDGRHHSSPGRRGDGGSAVQSAGASALGALGTALGTVGRGIVLLGSGIAAFFATLGTRLRAFLSPKILIPGAVKWFAFAGVCLLIFGGLRVKKASETPFDLMMSAVTASADLGNTNEGDNQMIRRLYGFDPSSFGGVALYCPKTNMGAEELLLVRLADESQEPAVLDAINRRLETQLASFNGYGVDQTEMLENSVTVSEGGYCLFYSGNNPQKVRSALREAL